MGFLSVPGWDRAKPSYLQFMKLTSIKLVKGERETEAGNVCSFDTFAQE